MYNKVMTKETIAIGKLYDDLLKEGYQIQYKKDYELITPKNIDIQTLGNRYVGLKAISRHKTPKHLVEVEVKMDNKTEHVTITTDHVCMVMNRDRFFDNTDAKNLKTGDYVSVYDEDSDWELIGTVTNIKDMGTTEEYVYDCEVDDDIHAFYCNDILIHNSQFVNIKCVTDNFKKMYNFDDVIFNWTDEQKLKLWNYIEGFVENEVNKFVQDLIRNNYHSEHPEVLRYSLEYMGDTEIMESKKHYSVRKIVSEGPEIVNKIKYSGIELKKASIPKPIKRFLAEIYTNTLTKNWTDADFRKYLNAIYPEFEKMDIEDISKWQGYSTSRESDGFLSMKKGATGISKACTYYNQLLENLGIGDKYEEILIGDKVKVCYIKPSNRFGIDIIAFKDGQYPNEFRKIFEVDYEKMWDKLIVSPLKNFVVATGFDKHPFDPRNMNMMDIDDL